MNGGEFLEPEAMYSIMAWRFSVWYFFLVSFRVSRCVFPFWGLLQVPLVLLEYCLSIQHFRYVFWLPYLCPKSFGFFCIRLLVCFRVTPSQLLMNYYYYYSLIRAFHINVSRWFFTGVWVTASLLKSPGLFLVFWPFSIILSFRWSLLVCQLPSPLVPLVIL